MRKEKTAPLPKRALPDALALCRQNFPDSGAALSPEGEGSVCPISLRRTAGAGGGLQADPVFGALDKGTAYRCRVTAGEKPSLPFVCGEGEPGKGHRRHFAERNGILCTKAGTAALTVNASPAGIAFYERQGFRPLSEERQADGLCFTPMELSLKGEPSCLPSDR